MFLRHFRFFSSKQGGISETISPRKPGRPFNDNVILTLDPNKFAEKKQRRLHIVNHQSFKPNVSLQNQSGLFPVVRPLSYDQTFKADTSRKLPSYPPDTKAFLYYFMSPEKPRIAGELRLRVASSDDLASFESGSDLLLTNGQPWSRPLCVLSKHYFPLIEKLREDQLVSDDLHTVLSTLPSRKPKYRRSQLLYTLNDTFIVDFSNMRLTFLVITEQDTDILHFYRIFAEQREVMCKGITDAKPYTGSALARFERSTLVHHKGTRTVVLRFLKIITPVKCVIPIYDDYICCPKEGELHRRGKSDSEWSINIDKSKKNNIRVIRGLRLLWDA